MVNKVILIGNLGKDPELSYTPSGVAVAKVSLATSEKWTDKSGERKERTDWHNLVFWRRNAEIANEYLRRGSQIYVEGRISTRSYDDKDGNKRYITEIEVQNFQMLGRRGEGGGEREGGGGAPRKNDAPSRQRDDGPHYEYEQRGGGGSSAPMGDPGFGPGGDDDDLPF